MFEVGVGGCPSAAGRCPEAANTAVQAAVNTAVQAAVRDFNPSMKKAAVPFWQCYQHQSFLRAHSWFCKKCCTMYTV